MDGPESPDNVRVSVTPDVESLTNLEGMLVENPCRGLVIGTDPNGATVHLYWVMGRSANSQNRVLSVQGSRVFTEPADPSKVEDPSLIIYDAMRFTDGALIVTNGDHTNTVVGQMKVNSLVSGSSYVPLNSFVSGLSSRYCEPDAPIFTPRIAGMSHNRGQEHMFGLLTPEPYAHDTWRDAAASLADDATRENVARLTGLSPDRFPTTRMFFQLQPRKGFGYCITTYLENDPVRLLPFDGQPAIVPITESLYGTMELFWEHLEPQWRVSLAGVRIEYGSGKMDIPDPINRFEKVLPS